MEGKKELVDKYYLQNIVEYYNFIKGAGREKDIPKIEPMKQYMKQRNYIKKI